MDLSVPEISLVVLVGASGSGKSTFAARHFGATEVLSSAYCRALVADDETDQTATNEAFGVLHFIARKRLEKGRLVVAHAGMKELYQGRGSGAVRSFASYGETTGETDEFGLPVRYNWAAEYRGKAMVVYGHTPVAEPEWLNNTICIDTGCVFGGRLTALRYPECELVSVSARRTYPSEKRVPWSGPPPRWLSLRGSLDACDRIKGGDALQTFFKTRQRGMSATPINQLCSQRTKAT